MGDLGATLVAAGTWVAGGLFAVAGVWSYRRRMGTAARWFAVATLVLAVGALGTGVIQTLPGNVSPLSVGVYPLVVLVVPIVWSRFILGYYGLFDFTSRRRTVALLAPALAASVAGVWASRVSGTVPPDVDSVAFALYIGYAVVHFYSAAVLVVSFGLLLHLSLSRPTLRPVVAATLATIVFAPWFGYMLNGIFRLYGVSALRPVEEGLRSVAFLAGASAAAAIVFRYRLFEQYPAAATAGPETVLAEMDDLVIVVDRPGTIVRVNDAARQAFAPDSTLVGRPACAVLDTTVDALAGREGIRLETATGPGQFDPSVSEMTDERGETIGHTLVLRDVTERYTQRQRLSVLNRALRHNIRNETTTIVTRADVIAEETSDGPAEMAADIVDTALEIADIGAKARRIEEMMAVPTTPNPRTDVRGVVDDIAATMRTRHTCDLTVSVPEGVVVRADERVLYPVLEGIVENAIEHNDRAVPTVVVTVTTDPDAQLPVGITVADDGPGIPEAEQRPLLAGAENRLEHGSGLGLWGVRWGVTRMGGELHFEENDPRGTVVTVELPAPTEPPPGTDDTVGDAGDPTEDGRETGTERRRD